MGTMSGWGGSGGKWNQVRDLSLEMLETDEETDNDELDELIDSIADALDEGESEQEQGGGDAPLPPPLPGGPSWDRGLQISGRGGGGDGPGGGGGGAGGGGGSGHAGGGRSRARAAGVGGAVLAAALAFQDEDAETLAELGLDLEELRSLDGFTRNNVILNTLVGADGGIEDTELRKVGARVLIGVLNDGLDAADAVRLYIVEFTFQVWAIETGDKQRTDPDRVKPSRDVERQLRAALLARAKGIEVSPGSGRDDLREAINASLALMRGLTEGL